ncbi:MAG: LuxR C-terminal-related transcriptional regulator [Actinomycetota bacterium]
MEDEALIARVLLFDGEALFRHSVQQVLDLEPDLHVVAETDDPSAVSDDAARTKPDIALLDADLVRPELGSLVRRVKAVAPMCKVLVITSSEEMGPLVEALEAGASGYLTKDASIWDLLEAARSVGRGDVAIPPQMVGALLSVLVGQRAVGGESRAKLAKLTRREREVLTLLGDGYDKDAIAAALVISPQTARTHVQNILSKLGMHSQLEAAAFARTEPVAHELDVQRITADDDSPKGPFRLAGSD